MPDYPKKLPGFRFRKAGDAVDEKLLADVREHGWHVVGVPDDDEGPGFCYTVGVYLRTLQPEMLMMGAPMETAHRILNAIAEHVTQGGCIEPETRCKGGLDGPEFFFVPSTRLSFTTISAAQAGSTGPPRIAIPA